MSGRRRPRGCAAARPALRRASPSTWVHRVSISPNTCRPSLPRQPWHPTSSPTALPALVPPQVLQVALQAEASPLHPHDMVAAWLAALAWVADPRWRRLSAGPHQAALMAWLEALELRVVALQLAQPEDFAPEGSGEGQGERGLRAGVLWGGSRGGVPSSSRAPRPSGSTAWDSTGCPTRRHAAWAPARGAAKSCRAWVRGWQRLLPCAVHLASSVGCLRPPHHAPTACRQRCAPPAQRRRRPAQVHAAAHPPAGGHPRPGPGAGRGR